MNISVIGLWRDSSATIKRTLSNLDELNKLGKFNFYFYENDSVDDTKEVLKNWLETKDGLLYSENIKAPKFGSVPDAERIILMSYYRNKAKTLIKNAESEYTLLIDTDINFSVEHFEILYKSMLDLDCAMVVSNTRQYQIPDFMNNETDDSFYDVSALRDSMNNYGLYFTDCPLLLNRDRELWSQNKPIPVAAGFSGFALIKTTILKRPDCYWSTCGNIEHVNFSYTIKKYGEIFIIPSCKPTTDINLSNINLDACKQIAANQKNRLYQINQIYNLSLAEKLI